MAYIETILKISDSYLKRSFNKNELSKFIHKLESLKNKNREETISEFCVLYSSYRKQLEQKKYKKSNKNLSDFISVDNSKVKIIWGDCLNALEQMDSESIQLMVTSPPYYNARDYSQWKNLDDYLNDMKEIIKESYRALENHRAWVFNIGDITGNDNLDTKSKWGARRIPLGAYFIKIFEECNFKFIDDFIWDKGEVESQRHKNGDNPYPLYQYPINSYEHIMVFYKHKEDKALYPCPVCGCLKVNGNAYAGVGIKSWECKNLECFERSVSNRGKRFSARSVMMNSLKNKQNIIDSNFVKQWHKDIIKINTVRKINSNGENILGHTAPFPFEIPEFAIKMLTGKNEIVLDPFAGSFTSAIQAQKMGRIGVGIEINKNLFAESIFKNIAKHLGKNKTEEFICQRKNKKIVKNETYHFASESFGF